MEAVRDCADLDAMRDENDHGVTWYQVKGLQ